MVGIKLKIYQVSKERYFELYRQFLNNTISDKDYRDLMKWVSDKRNDATLRRYMETLWSENDWVEDEQVADWDTFKKQFTTQKESSVKVLGLNTGTRRTKRIWSYAAAVVLLALLAGYGLINSWSSEATIYHTAYGETQEIQLEDGSVVTLNANSTLEWKSGWKRSGERHVVLTGEAFFDVSHTDDAAAFTVETNDLSVRVLGTTFNVSARRDRTGVTLETGKIELDLKQTDEKPLAMEPGDFVQFSATTNDLERSKVQSINQSTDWMAGVLRFEDVTVEEMFNEIEDQYGKKLITTDSSLLERRMFTGIPYEDWIVAKEALELALGVKFEERGNELYIQK